MPDPARLVARSISLMKDMGIPEVEAVAFMQFIARRLALRIAMTRNAPQAWVVQVCQIVEDRAAALHPSSEDTQEMTDGDGKQHGARS